MVRRSPTQSLWRYALNDLSGLVFAALWAIRGTTALRLPLPTCLGLITGITLVLAWGFLARDLTSRRPEYIHDPVLARRTRLLRFILLFLSGMGLSAIHRPDLMLVTTGTIIGGSYIPLGRSMNEPVHTWTGIAIIGLSLIALAFSPSIHGGIAGLGTALSLWVGAAIRLGRGRIAKLTIPATIETSAENVHR